MHTLDELNVMPEAAFVTRFGVSSPEGHYHIPLLLGTWSYTTCRGT